MELKREIYEAMPHELRTLMLLGLSLVISMIFRFSSIQVIIAIISLGCGFVFYRLKETKDDELHLVVRMIFALSGSVICIITSALILKDIGSYNSILPMTFFCVAGLFTIYYYNESKSRADDYLEHIELDDSRNDKRIGGIVGSVSGIMGFFLYGYVSDNYIMYIEIGILLIWGMLMLVSVKWYFMIKEIKRRID